MTDVIPGPEGFRSDCGHCIEPRDDLITHVGNTLYFLSSVGEEGPLWKLEAPEGDTNFDGRVDFQDFLRLSRNFGRRGENLGGDLNYDGAIDFLDFTILAANFGTHDDRSEMSV